MNENDPEASQRISNILQSPAYRRADRDVDFLNDNDVRGVRLQLDYLKTELNLRRHGIEQTIVIFGSARIPDTVIAKQRVADLLAALQETPNDVTLTQELRIAERTLANSRYYSVARDFAALVAFPGGFGTLDEVFETLTLIQTKTIEPLPVILVGESFWRGVFDPDFMVSEGVISAEDRQLFSYAETADQIWTAICTWHRNAGEILLCEDQL